jgi:hypothetical protein
VSCMHGTTKGADLFEVVVKTVDRVELKWEKLCSVTRRRTMHVGS